MKPYKLEFYIKNQLENREIAPSEDLWQKIQAKLEEDVSEKKTTHFRWLWLAASLFIGGFLLYIFTGNSESINNSGDFVQQQTAPLNSKISLEPKEIKNIPPPIIHQNAEEKPVEIFKKQIKIADAKKVEVLPLQENIVSNTENLPKEENIIPKKETPNLVANLDSTSSQKPQRKNYVDPETLLFSVEHKDAIEKTKERKSNIATIDLNKK